MASRNNNNSPGPGALDAEQTTSEGVRADAADFSSISGLNIPNDGENYQWFLPEPSGGRPTISPSNFAEKRIRADMNINTIVNHILSHVGA